MSSRYIGVHRAEEKLHTNDLEVALQWLRDLSSIAATLVDTETGHSWKVNADGSVVKSIDTPALRPADQREHGRERSNLWTRNDPDLVPPADAKADVERMIRPALRTTYTYAILEISKAAYDEIQNKLAAAGYTHAFQQTSDGAVIDMHGIALQQEPSE